METDSAELTASALALEVLMWKAKKHSARTPHCSVLQRASNLTNC